MEGGRGRWDLPQVDTAADTLPHRYLGSYTSTEGDAVVDISANSCLSSTSRRHD